MIPIPDHPSGERFCRKCGVFLPLKDFFKGKKRRYTCKVHSRGRPRKRHAPSKKQKRPPCVKKASQSPETKTKNAIAQVWHAAYTDCRSSFGQATVGMSQGELRDLFEATGGAEPSTEFRLVPIDPCRALAAGNASMAAMQEEDDASGGEVGGGGGQEVEGPGQPGGPVRVEERTEEMVENQQEQVGEGKGTDGEGDDDDEDDDDVRLLVMPLHSLPMPARRPAPQLLLPCPPSPSRLQGQHNCGNTTIPTTESWFVVAARSQGGVLASPHTGTTQRSLHRCSVVAVCRLSAIRRRAPSLWYNRASSVRGQDLSPLCLS